MGPGIESAARGAAGCAPGQGGGLITIPSCKWTRSYYSSGIDEWLQGFQGDAYGSMARFGLRVPGLPTPTLDMGGNVLRYLFRGFSKMIPARSAVIIRGIQTLQWLGANPKAQRFTELQVGDYSGGDPAYRWPDGNVSYHLRIIKHGESPDWQVGPMDTNNFMFRNKGTGPALLYENATFNAANLSASGRPDYYVNLTAYTPPHNGRPWGRPVDNEFSDITDTRYPRMVPCEICVPGPGVLTGFISVRQTNPETRVKLTGAFGDYDTDGLSREENFAFNFPTTGNTWAVGLAVAIEELG